MKFLWKSDNAHGVHSPFVYNIITQCFYNKAPKSYTKTKEHSTENITPQSIKTLHKIVAGLNPTKLYILSDEAPEITEILRTSGEVLNARVWFFSTLAPVPSAIDLAYISSEDTATAIPLLEQVVPNTNDNSTCVVGNIYATEETTRAWEAIKNHPDVTVTIDTYHLGLVFFRGGQAKQHFTIRTNTSWLLNAFLGSKKLWGLLG
ncbi:MAG: hypothetical protein BM557_10205 [Flavobacterium sp. MedPE-SWcel]|nr:MAG: hypothetical protein BM557_10205 [Flavobacterium sp. MedPE-SWcel]